MALPSSARIGGGWGCGKNSLLAICLLKKDFGFHLFGCVVVGFVRHESCLGLGE